MGAFEAPEGGYPEMGYDASGDKRINAHDLLSLVDDMIKGSGAGRHTELFNFALYWIQEDYGARVLLEAARQ